MKRLNTFLERELRLINRDCFRGRLPLPAIELLRLKYSWDILAEGYVGAYYRPPQTDRPAEIGISPLVLTTPEEARIALAHEMVHHWEWHHRHRPSEMICPSPVHFLVRRQFPSAEKQYHWRLAHSFQFMAKAGEVSRILGISLKDFLFKNLRKK